MTARTPTDSWTLFSKASGALKKVLLPAFVLVTVPSAISSFLLQRMSENIDAYVRKNGQLTTIDQFVSAAGSSQLLYGIIAAALLANFYALTFIYIISQKKPEDVSLRESIERAIRLFPRYLGTSILQAIIILTGLVLFIVPGIIFLRRYILANFYVVNRNLSIIDALKTSSQESKPVSSYVYGTIGVYFVVAIAASIIDGIVSDVSFPVLGAVISGFVSAALTILLFLRYKEISLQRGKS